MESKEETIKFPGRFIQLSESTPPKTVLVHISGMEAFICSLNPAGSLYDDVADEDEVTNCFEEIKKYLESKNINLITVKDALLLEGCSKELMSLAKDSLNYIKETKDNCCDEIMDQEKIKKRKKCFEEYTNYCSDDYKEKVLDKFSKKNIINTILTRPSIRLKYTDTDTYIQPTLIQFCPLGNLVFCRDQQITTKKGVVMGRSRTAQRKYEHIIMKQVFKNLKVDIIGEIPENGFLEGGDFFVARENLSMLGVGLRTNFEGANYLMENDLLGTRYMALCVDENDLDQQRMHLDTYFNILNDNNALVIDFEQVGKQVGKNIGRKVFYYDNNEDTKEIQSNNKDIKNKIGKYKLVKIFEDFYKFLEEMKFNYIKITHQEQKEYMINFLNIGNNTVISVNKDLEKKVKDLQITVKYFNCKPILNMYGGMHCMTQVSRF